MNGSQPVIQVLGLWKAGTQRRKGFVPNTFKLNTPGKHKAKGNLWKLFPVQHGSEQRRVRFHSNGVNTVRNNMKWKEEEMELEREPRDTLQKRLGVGRSSPLHPCPTHLGAHSLTGSPISPESSDTEQHLKYPAGKKPESLTQRGHP